MPTTLILDDDLIAEARLYSGLTDESAIVHEALKAFVRREAGRRLARLGGMGSSLMGVPRRWRDAG